MAMVYTTLDNSEITDPRLKAFMHRRTRQWKYSDLSWSPTTCTQLPDDYPSDSPGQATPKVPQTIRWDDVLPEAGPLPEITKSNAKWSKEAVLALVGILVAILLFVLGIASKTIRRWFINAFRRTYGMLLGHPRSLRQSASISALLSIVKKTILRRDYCSGVLRNG